MTALFCVLAFVAAAVIDLAHTAYIRSVERGAAHRAACWSVVMYAVGCAGFYLCVGVTWAYMIPEALGYYAGTWLAMNPLVDRYLHSRAPLAHLVHGSGSPD